MSSLETQETTQADNMLCWRCRKAVAVHWTFCASCGASLRDMRLPPAPNPELDVQFLSDIYSFGWYNHHTAAVALYDSVATVERFYGDDVEERFILLIEEGRTQQILRSKIFAEWIGLLEALGMLCLAVKKRKRQSMIWTYTSAEPQEVTQFYQSILTQGSNRFSIGKLLELPQISRLRCALQQQSFADEQDTINAIMNDYREHSPNLRLLANMYLDNDGANVRIYNKIKHGFPIVEGQGYFNPPIDSERVAILMGLSGEVGRLPMSQSGVDLEMENIHQVTKFGGELLALCLQIHKVGMLWSKEE